METENEMETEETALESIRERESATEYFREKAFAAVCTSNN